jgi:hypothetical protein
MVLNAKILPFVTFLSFNLVHEVMLLNLILFQGADTFFRAILSNMEKVYLSRNPTVKTIIDLVHSHRG